MNEVYEAFRSLDLLNEDVFDISAEGTSELKTLLDTPIGELDLIIDPEAVTEEDLQDSYLGKVVLECDICKSMIYSEPSEVVLNEDGIANFGEECLYCQSAEGFNVIGQITEYKEEVEDEATEETTEEEADEKVSDKEAKEFLEESLKDELKNKSKFYKKGFKQGRDAYESGTSLTWKQGSPLSELKAGDILDIDDLDEADEKVSDKDAKEFLAGHQAGMDYQAERLNESRKLKENKDFNVFTEIEYDNIWDWHEDDESLYGKDGKFGLIVTGNRNFQEFFYVRERLEDIKEAFEEYDGQELLDKLKEITGKEYVETQFSGYSQGDWQNAYYPKDEFTDERIKILNDSYMGKYQVFEDIDGDTFVVYDSLNKSIKDQIASQASVPVEKIRIRSISGYSRTPNYIEESRKLNERLSREDWDVINDAVKYVIKNHEKITGKPLSAIFNTPSDDARPLFNQDVIDEINSKVKETVQRKFPELKDRTMFEEFLYKLDEELIDYAPRLNESIQELFESKKLKGIDKQKSLREGYSDAFLNMEDFMVNYEDVEEEDIDILDDSEDEDELYNFLYKYIQNEEEFHYYAGNRATLKGFAKYIANKNKKRLNEDTNVLIKTDDKEIKINTEDGDVDVKVEDKEKEIDAEMIGPLTDEVEDEFVEEDEYEEVDLEEFDEVRFDELQERYFRENFENVKSYKTKKCSINGNKLKLEGIIEFKSGNKKLTNFIYEANTVNKETGKVTLIGENKQFTNKTKAFTLGGKVKNNKLMVESLKYDHNVIDQGTGNIKRLNGTLR